MPVVLVLFAIALVVTFIGVFLSPRSQSRPTRDVYTSAPKVRSSTRATPASPTHARMRWSESGSAVAPLKARASRASVQAVRSPLASSLIASPRPSIVIGDGIWGRLNSWKVIVPGLTTLFLLCFYLLNTTLSHPLLWSAGFFGSASQQATPASAPASPNYAASQHLLRLGQLDPGQYRSTQEYTTWAYSACSAASMTEVINAYGHTYRITDILAVEARIHEITPQLGLLEESGIQHTGAQFGFNTSEGHNLSLDQVIAAANHGTPVIVSFPPERFAGGHILVVRGGNADVVYLADSSGLNWTQLSRSRFMQLWGGFSAIMTPR